jgi:antiviral helicase SKI2
MSDDLPYLGQLAQHFASLPNKFAELSLRTTFVPLSDIECVTETIIKADAPLKAFTSKKESKQFATDQLLPLVQSWAFQDWDELNWRKIKDLTVQNLLDERKKIGDEAQDKKCLTCPKFLQHYTMQHDEWVIRENIAQLRQLMSDQNLQLLPDYEQRIEVLKELGFVDDNSRVELKGKVACEVSNRAILNLSLQRLTSNRFIPQTNLSSQNSSSKTSLQTTSRKK